MGQPPNMVVGLFALDVVIMSMCIHVKVNRAGNWTYSNKKQLFGFLKICIYCQRYLEQWRNLYICYLNQV
jgi:hypothetical protein